MIEIINERVRRLHGDELVMVMNISDSTLQFLLINCNARAGRFYLLPKIHKKNFPGGRLFLVATHLQRKYLLLSIIRGAGIAQW